MWSIALLKMMALPSVFAAGATAHPLAGYRQRFSAFQLELENELPLQMRDDSGQETQIEDWRWVLDLERRPARATVYPSHSPKEDDFPVEVFLPRPSPATPSRGKRALSSAIGGAPLPAEGITMMPDDTSFPSINLANPRPSFHATAAANAKWLGLLDEASGGLQGIEGEDEQAEMQVDGVQEICEAPPSAADSAPDDGTTNSATNQPNGQVDFFAGMPDSNETHSGTINTSSILRPSTNAGSGESAASHARNDRSDADHDAATALTQRTRTALARHRLQDEVRQHHQQRPFESEMDLTDPSISTGTDRQEDSSARSKDKAAGSSNSEPQRGADARGPVTPAVQRTDFADMTVFTTPGDETIGERAEPPSTPRRQVDSANGNRPPRPSRKKVTPNVHVSRDKRASPTTDARVSNTSPAAPYESETQSEASLTESQSNTESEDDREGDHRGRRVLSSKPPQMSFANRASAFRSTLALSAALEQEQAAATRRKADGPAERMKRLQGQEKRIRATRKRVGDEGGGKDEAATGSLAMSSNAPPTRAVRRAHSSEDAGSSKAGPSKRSNTRGGDDGATATAASASTSRKSTSANGKRIVRRPVPIKKPNWTSMEDCVGTWAKWAEEGRDIHQGSGRAASLFRNVVFLLVGRWDKSMAAWVERIVVRGGSIVPCFPHAKQSTITHVVSIGVPRAPGKAACEASLGVNALEDLSRDAPGIRFVTQEWIMQCISEERIVDEGDERWQLK